MNKRMIWLAGLLVVALLAGCSNQGQPGPETTAEPSPTALEESERIAQLVWRLHGPYGRAKQPVS